jgi:hypothetical protein
MRFNMLASALGVVVSALALSACGDVGEGNKPDKVALLPFEGRLGDASMKAYPCVPTNARLVLTFTDGSEGDFSDRSQWVSSNPAVVKVSNGAEIFTGGGNGQRFQASGSGILIPVGVGSAVITATYQGLRASITVNVSEGSDFALSQTNLNMAPTTVQPLGVTAKLAGVSTGLNNAVAWRFSAANDAVATLATDASNLTRLTAVAEGNLTLNADFLACDKTLSTPVTVSNATGVTLTREFSGSLPINTDQLFFPLEVLTLNATLANGQTQNVSLQSGATFSSANTALVAFGAAGSTGQNFISPFAAGGPTTVTGSFAGFSATQNISADTRTLRDVAVTPKTASVPFGTTQQFTATGTFTDGSTFDVTRQMSWTSGDVGIALINNTGFGAGLAAGVRAGIGQSTVMTAAFPRATGTASDTATLSITDPTPPATAAASATAP